MHQGDCHPADGSTPYLIDISVISLVIGINFILEMLLGMVNSVGDVVVALLVARKEGTLDLDTYRKK